MGVMACDRKGCDNIMCSTYIDSFGYMCEACKRDFRNFLLKNNVKGNHPKSIFLEQLNLFNTYNKGDEYEMSVDEFLNS